MPGAEIPEPIVWLSPAQVDALLARLRALIDGDRA